MYCCTSLSVFCSTWHPTNTVLRITVCCTTSEEKWKIYGKESNVHFNGWNISVGLVTWINYWESTIVRKDVAKRDMQAIGLPIDSWETLASDRSAWKTNCTEALREGEKLLHITVDTRRERQKASALAPSADSTYVCGSCHRICRSRIGLQIHLRKCLRKCTITNTG